MLCDVILTLVIAYSDGTSEQVQRQGARLDQVEQVKNEIAKVKADPTLQAKMIKNGIVDVKIEVKKMPKQFDCSKDPEAQPEGN